MGYTYDEIDRVITSNNYYKSDSDSDSDQFINLLI
jgi:hypothetical protein